MFFVVPSLPHNIHEHREADVKREKRDMLTKLTSIDLVQTHTNHIQPLALNHSLTKSRGPQTLLRQHLEAMLHLLQIR